MLSPMRRILSPRLFFFAASLVLWVAAALVAVELYERWTARRQVEASRADVMQLQTALHPELEAIATKYAGAPPIPAGDFAARDGFEALAEAERVAYVNSRGEAVLLLDASGTVRQVYTPEQPASVAAFTSAITPGTALTNRLGDEPAADFRNTLPQVLSGGGTQLRDYPVSLADGGEEVLQFAFVPLRNSGEAVACAFVRLSMWKELWVSFRPNVRQDDAYTFSTNALGWRDGEVALPKPEGVYRIVCVGGSTTAEGPTNALTYPKLLERMLADRYGAGRIEVINAGVFASNAHTEMERLDQYLALEPDLVVHYNVVNDITMLLPDWLNEGRSTWQRALAVSHLAYNRFNTLLLPPEEFLAEQLRTAVMMPLDKLAQGITLGGAKMVFASFGAPDYAALPSAEKAFFDANINNMLWGRNVNMAGYTRVVSLYNELLQQFCDENGYAFLPVADRITGGADIYTDICHMNLKGLERKAQAFAELLAPLLDEALAP